MKRPALLLLAALPLPLLAQDPAPPRPSVVIPRIEADATIDGVFDEPAWQQATVIRDFHQYRPVDGRPAEDSTVVMIWYSPTAIHFGIRAYDRDPAGVRATLADRDNIGSDDQVTIYLDTFNDRRRAYFFGVNPLGVQDDGVRAEGGFVASFQSGTVDRNPDFIYETSGRRTPDGWVVEMRVPFKSLRYDPADVQTWGFNVARTTQRTQYEDTWTDVRRAGASFLAQAGLITGIHDIKRGVVTELQPTVTAGLPGVRTGGQFERGDVALDVGGNVRLGFTNLTLDGTINPDFSQVESDAGLVTVNERFALFFPERRPFFLEGIELFASPNNLVYTRTIANPLVGAKLTGKFGKWSVAHLSAIDEFGGDAANALVNISRVRRDVGANSVAGLTVTDRERDGGFNRVLSADTRLVFAELYYLQAQLGASWTRNTASGETKSDPIWQLEADRTGRLFGFNYKLIGIGEDFAAQSGFVNRTGIVTASGFNRLAFYGGRGNLVESVTLFGGGNRIWNYDDVFAARAIEGGTELNSSVRLRGGWNVSTRIDNGFVRFNAADYAGYTVVAPGQLEPFVPPSGVFDAWSGRLTVGTPQFRQWDGSITLAGGATAIFPEAARGARRQVQASVTVRPSPSFRAFGTVTWTRLTRSSDATEFARTVIPRLKVEFQPKRSLFFRVVGEYRSERRDALRAADGRVLFIGGNPAPSSLTNRLRMDWLASYEPTPGTVAFFGYGSTLDTDQELSLRGLERRDDGFFVKLAYLFRR